MSGNFSTNPSADDGLAISDGDGLFWQQSATWNGSFGGTIFYGANGDIPLVGDWNCNGQDSLAVFRPSNHRWYFRNDNMSGIAEWSIAYGRATDIPIVGNWDAGHCGDEIGVVRGNRWYLKRDPHSTSGIHDIAFNYGSAGMKPMLGDGDGDGDDTPAYYL